VARRPAVTVPAPVGAAARLSRSRIVDAAIALADRDGLDGLSMRKLGQQLGVDPMAVYHHVRDKNELLAEMVDRVIATITVERSGTWDDALQATIQSARRTMLDHPWTVRVIEDQRAPTPAGLRYLDAVLGILRDGGFSVALCHHALHVLGSRILGFSQDLYDDSPDDPRPTPAAAAAQAREWASALPHLAELASSVSHQGGLGGCDDDAEFAFALDLIIEGLAQRLADG